MGVIEEGECYGLIVYPKIYMLKLPMCLYLDTGLLSEVKRVGSESNRTGVLIKKKKKGRDITLCAYAYKEKAM